MKKMFKFCFIFILSLTFFLPQNSVNANNSNESPLNFKETENAIEIDIDLNSLDFFEETKVYDDGYSSVTITKTPDLFNPINTYSYDSGWSSGQIPWSNSTLSIRARSGMNFVNFSVVANGQHSKLSNFSNLSYGIFSYTLSNTQAGIKFSYATNNRNALAEWTTVAKLEQAGLVAGTRYLYVRAELNTNNNFRLSYNLD